MITSAQMRAARALLGIDQRTLAGLADLSVPTIQRMEASPGNVRGVVDSLTKVVQALELAGVELIAEGASSLSGGAWRSPEGAFWIGPHVTWGARPPTRADDPAAGLTRCGKR